MREILLATGNPGKAREMREILGAGTGDGAICWRSLDEFEPWPEPVEDRATFRDNAALKAHYYAQKSGRWTIADDSGLEVDALDGAPGIRSARYAGEPKDDAANNGLLVRELADVPTEQRTARFRCAVALSDGQRVLTSAEGTVEGRIVDEPQGCNGFGYDPHFYVDEQRMTVAQMSPEVKHAISHRGQALRQLRVKLLGLLDQPEARS